MRKTLVEFSPETRLPFPTSRRAVGVVEMVECKAASGKHISHVLFALNVVGPVIGSDWSLASISGLLRRTICSQEVEESAFSKPVIARNKSLRSPLEETWMISRPGTDKTKFPKKN